MINLYALTFAELAKLLAAAWRAALSRPADLGLDV